MLKRLSIALVILFINISICIAGSEPDMKEGKWEITKKISIPAMGMDMPPKNYTQCLTKKDLIPQNYQSGQKCKISDKKSVNNIVTWALQCTGGHGGDMKGKGEITYAGKSLKGKVELKGAQPGMGMISNLSGIYIGDCK